MVAKHETNHISQNCSNLEKTKEGYSKNLGIVYKWDDLEFNTLGFQWFEEGGAEELMIIENPEYGESNTYIYILDAMDTLSLAGVYKYDNSEYTLSKISLQGDLNKLFDIFGCESDEDKIEIINMMYTLEIINNNRNNDFSEAYYNKYGNNFFAPDYTDKFYTKCSESLSKIFYLNMLNGLENKEETLDNIFATINVFETNLNSMTKIRSGIMDYHKDFLNTYYLSQQSFFKAVAKNLNMSIDEINYLYSDYSSKTTNVFNNSTILSPENRSLINRISNEKQILRLNGEMCTISDFYEKSR